MVVCFGKALRCRFVLETPILPRTFAIIPRILWNPEVSLTPSQQANSSLYSEPDESSPRRRKIQNTHFIFNGILSIIVSLVRQCGKIL